MSTRPQHEVATRTPLSRERVVRAAVALADEVGIDAVSMRKLGQLLGVEAMSLYNHVDHKEDLLDGMVDLIVSDIEVPSGGTDWKATMRARALSARSVLLLHLWAPRVIESRTKPSLPFLRYLDTIVGTLRDGGFSDDLAHHALHALGSRILGFSQELFTDSQELEESPEIAAFMLQQRVREYPNLTAMMPSISHDADSIVGMGCDDEFEFEFALDLLLDGLERLRDAEAR